MKQLCSLTEATCLFGDQFINGDQVAYFHGIFGMHALLKQISSLTLFMLSLQKCLSCDIFNQLEHSVAYSMLV